MSEVDTKRSVAHQLEELRQTAIADAAARAKEEQSVRHQQAAVRLQLIECVRVCAEAGCDFDVLAERTGYSASTLRSWVRVEKAEANEDEQVEHIADAVRGDSDGDE